MQGVGENDHSTSGTMNCPRNIPGEWIGDKSVRLSEPMVFAEGPPKIVRTEVVIDGLQATEVSDASRQWTVPAGFVTDFASTPQRLHMQFLVVAFAAIWYFAADPWQWWMLGALAIAIAIRRLVPPPTGLHGPAAILHDWGYATGKLSKPEADWQFLLFMRHLGVSRFRRVAMFLAVALFGYWPYFGHWARRHGGIRKMMRDLFNTFPLLGS